MCLTRLVILYSELEIRELRSFKTFLGFVFIDQKPFQFRWSKSVSLVRFDKNSEFFMKNEAPSWYSPKHSRGKIKAQHLAFCRQLIAKPIYGCSKRMFSNEFGKEAATFWSYPYLLDSSFGSSAISKFPINPSGVEHLLCKRLNMPIYSTLKALQNVKNDMP